MKYLKLLVTALLASALFLTAPALDQARIARAQDTTSQTTGYPTGAICPKTGTYRARNQYLENILVVTKGKAFPSFSDGSKAIWYPLKEKE